jgi:hypothetical protein
MHRRLTIGRSKKYYFGIAGRRPRQPRLLISKKASKRQNQGTKEKAARNQEFTQQKDQAMERKREREEEKGARPIYPLAPVQQPRGFDGAHQHVTVQ